jgi:L-lactate dehydrogenase
VKVGVVGVGNVGSATVLSLLEGGGMCKELVLVDRSMERANGVATDLRYATPLVPTVDVYAGDYDAHDEPVTFQVDGFDGGSVSMLGVRIG